MKFINILIVLSLLSFLSCTKKEEKVEIIIEDVIETQMLESYKKLSMKEMHYMQQGTLQMLSYYFHNQNGHQNHY